MLLKIKENIKKIDYRHYILSSITFIFLCLSIFYFKYAFVRIIESIKDLGTSSIYYLKNLVDIKDGQVTVNNFTKAPFEMPFNLPNTWDEFKDMTSSYWTIFFSKENFNNYLKVLSDVIYYISKILMIILPFVLMLGLF